MRILPPGCERHQDDADVLVAVSLDRSGAVRASLLAARLATIASMSPGLPDGRGLGETVQALDALERLLITDGGQTVELASFLERFVELRAIVAGRGRFRLSTIDVTVAFALARYVGYVVCDLVTVVETMRTSDEPDVRIAVHPDGDKLVIAVAADISCAAAVPDLAGARALKRVESLVHSVGGGLARGIRSGDMLFGVTLPVVDD